MIEMPELFDRHMNLGLKALSEELYEEAREHFEAAYNLESDKRANLYLVKTLVKLKLYAESYQILNEKKQIYLQEPEFQAIYFELLLQLHYFYEIEKLLANLGNEEKEPFQKAYDIAKDYQLLMNKDKYEELMNELYDLGNVLPMKQGQVLKQLNLLTKEQVALVAKKLLVEKKVAIFTRSELVQQLAQGKLTENFDILTWQGELKSFIPSQVLSLQGVYQESSLLKELATFFAQNAPSLSKDVERTVKLHLGCFYPFHEIEMEPVDVWVESYIEKYYGKPSKVVDDEVLEEIILKQAKLDEEVFKLLSFD